MAVGLKVSITQNSQSIENYTSNVTVTVAVSWGSGSFSNDVLYGTAIIDGTSYSFSGSFNSDGETQTGSKTLFSKTLDVAHDTSTGKKTVQVSASYNTSYWGVLTASKSLELTAFPLRYTLSMSAGTGSTIDVNRINSPQANASIGSLDDGVYIYTNDVLQINFVASTGYEILTKTVNGSDFTSGNSHTVDGAVSVITTTRMLGLAYIANGTINEKYLIYIENGVDWYLYIPYIDNGTSWDICS